MFQAKDIPVNGTKDRYRAIQCVKCGLIAGLENLALRTRSLNPD